MGKETTGKIRTQDKLSLFYRKWPGKPDRPVILMVHGLGEHSGRYQNPAQYFNDRGYTLYAYDQRGHGRSDGPRGYAERFARLLGDLHTVLAMIRKKEPGKKLFLVGHSFGGEVVLTYASRYENGLAGVLVSSPNVRLAMPVPWLKRQFGQLVSNFLPTLSLPSGVNAEYLSHDAAVIQAYLNDPLVNSRITVRLATEMFANQDKLLLLARQFRLPVLFMHAGDDQICDPEGTEDFYKACASQDKRFKLYPGFYHELFNEIDKVRVFKDMEQWLTKHH